MALTYSWPGNIADSAIDPDSPIDTSLMTSIRNSIVHNYEWLGKTFTPAQDHDHDGSNSKSVVLAAGVVSETKMASSAVSQAKLKSTTASGSLAINSQESNPYALTGGTYSWWTASADSTDGATTSGFAFGHDDTAGGSIGLYNLNPGSPGGSIYVDERYIQASPPYRLGPLFIFLLVNPDGTFAGVRVMPDPPWAYHGPTNITPEFYSLDGKPYRLAETIQGVPLARALKDRATARRFGTGQIEIDVAPVEITLEYKDSDMLVVPHPFDARSVKPGQAIVLLEPGTALMDRFAAMCDLSHAHVVRDLIRDNEIKINNTALDVPHAPPGVMVARAAFKLTK